MRAKEFIFNVSVPISIKLNGDGEPEIDTSEPDEDGQVFVPPLQQDIELKKAAVGKISPVIKSLTDDE